MRHGWADLFGALMIAVAGGAAGAVMTTSDGGRFSDAALGAVSTLAAAYFGSRYAFTLDREDRSRVERERQVAALNRVMFGLARRWNHLASYHKQFVQAVEQDGELRWLTLRATRPSPPAPPLNLDDLMFLIERDGADLLMRIEVESRRHITIQEAIDSRSAMVTQQLHPVLDKLGIRPGERFDASAVSKEVPAPLSTTLKARTELLERQILELLRTTPALCSEVRDVGIKAFPGASFIRAIVRDDEGSEQTTDP